MERQAQGPAEPHTLKEFKRQFPAVWEAYERLRAACDHQGPLDEKTRELIKVGISAALRREGGLIAHMAKALKAGATRDEVYQAIVLATGLVGFPATLGSFAVAHRYLAGQS